MGLQDSRASMIRAIVHAAIFSLFLLLYVGDHHEIGERFLGCFVCLAATAVDTMNTIHTALVVLGASLLCNSSVHYASAIIALHAAAIPMDFSIASADTIAFLAHRAFMCCLERFNLQYIVLRIRGNDAYWMKGITPDLRSNQTASSTRFRTTCGSMRPRGAIGEYGSTIYSQRQQSRRRNRCRSCRQSCRERFSTTLSYA